MDLSAIQVAAAIAFLAWSCPLVTKRHPPYAALKKRGVPVPAMLVLDAEIACIAGFVIAEWWALLIPYVGLALGFPSALKDPELRSDVSEVGSIPLVIAAFVVFLGFLVVLPVAIGVAIARAI